MADDRKSFRGFIKDAKGRTLFYPWGNCGRGFIIKSEESQTDVLRIRNHYLRISSIISFIVFVSSMLAIRYTIRSNSIVISLDITLLTFFCSLFYLYHYDFPKKLSQNVEKLGFFESYQSVAHALDWRRLLLLGSSCVLLTLASADDLLESLQASKLEKVILCIFMLIPFGALSVVYSYIMTIKLRNK